MFYIIYFINTNIYLKINIIITKKSNVNYSPITFIFVIISMYYEAFTFVISTIRLHLYCIYLCELYICIACTIQKWTSVVAKAIKYGSNSIFTNVYSILARSSFTFIVQTVNPCNIYVLFTSYLFFFNSRRLVLIIITCYTDI